METHKAVFGWVLKILAEEGLVEGKTVSIDATTLEANAALRSLVRRDNGQKYEDYLKELGKAAGMENPTREQLARLDRKRKKKGSNKEWKNPYDPDARVACLGSDAGVTFQSRTVDVASGKAKRMSRSMCMPTGGACGGLAAKACSGNEAISGAREKGQNGAEVAPGSSTDSFPLDGGIS